MEVKLGAHVYYIVSMVTTSNNSLRHFSLKLRLVSPSLLTVAHMTRQMTRLSRHENPVCSFVDESSDCTVIDIRILYIHATICWSSVVDPVAQCLLWWLYCTPSDVGPNGTLAGLCILAFSLFFTAFLLNSVVSGETPFCFQALVARKPLVSLISRLVACSARISGDKQTHTQTKYFNPRCVCVPRVNYWCSMPF